MKISELTKKPVGFTYWFEKDSLGAHTNILGAFRRMDGKARLEEHVAIPTQRKSLESLKTVEVIMKLTVIKKCRELKSKGRKRNED